MHYLYVSVVSEPHSSEQYPKVTFYFYITNTYINIFSNAKIYCGNGMKNDSKRSWSWTSTNKCGNIYFCTRQQAFKSKRIHANSPEDRGRQTIFLSSLLHFMLEIHKYYNFISNFLENRFLWIVANATAYNKGMTHLYHIDSRIFLTTLLKHWPLSTNTAIQVQQVK